MRASLYRAVSWLVAASSVAVSACGRSKAVGESVGGADAGAVVVESACVRAAVRLPWSEPVSGPSLRLEVAAISGAIAVANRTDSELAVRVYDAAGTFVAARAFAADAQLLGSRDGRFTAIARDGDAFVATALDRGLAAGTVLQAQRSTAGERALAATFIASAPVLVTDERFLNLANGAAASWATALASNPNTSFKTGRMYGLTANDDAALIAWGMQDVLGLVVVDSAGKIVAQSVDDELLGYLGSQTATAMPHEGGLLLFDGNPVRATLIDFVLARTPLKPNMQLRTFYRTAPRVAGLTFDGRPLALWLSVFPTSDNSQGVTPHQLYACALDLAAPAACASTSLIATTDFSGYDISARPVVAAALPGATTFAVAHTDADGRSWLRVADLSCHQP